MRVCWHSGCPGKNRTPDAILRTEKNWFKNPVICVYRSLWTSPKIHCQTKTQNIGRRIQEELSSLHESDGGPVQSAQQRQHRRRSAHLSFTSIDFKWRSDFRYLFSNLNAKAQIDSSCDTCHQVTRSQTSASVFSSEVRSLLFCEGLKVAARRKVLRGIVARCRHANNSDGAEPHRCSQTQREPSRFGCKSWVVGVSLRRRRIVA